MNRHRYRSTLWVVAIWFAFFVAMAHDANADTRTQQADVPAAGLQSILLQAGNGSARIAAGSDDRIRVRVEVSPKEWTDKKPFSSIRSWFLTSSYDDIGELLDAVRIVTDEREGSTVRIGLTPAGSGRKDRVSERWTITVPARMAVAVRMDYAEIEVSGVAGGADVEAGAGSVRVEVPRGDLRVALQVGDVEVQSGSGSVGNVELRSTVGSTRLSMNGMRFKYPNPPGPGSEVSVSGQGDDTVRVVVEVGDVSVNVKGDEASQ